MSVGTKEIQDILKGLEAVGVKGAVLRDGFQVFDIPALIGIISPVVAAIKGANLISDEIKDLDEAEIQELGQLTLEMVENIKNAWIA